MATTRLLDSIKNEKVFRIYTDRAPGSGNQAAGLNLIKYVREKFLFKGLIEFIYPIEITDKISSLFHLSNIGSLYFLETENILLINGKAHLERLNDVNFKTVKFGAAIVTGSPAGLIPKNQPLYNIRHTHFIDNPALFLNTEIFIEFDPYMNSPMRKTAIYIRDESRSIRIEKSAYQYYVFPRSTLDEAKLFLENDPEGQQIIRNKPGLKPFLTAMESGQSNIFPIYGFTVRNDNLHSISKSKVIEDPSTLDLAHFPKNAKVFTMPSDTIIYWLDDNQHKKSKVIRDPTTLDLTHFPKNAKIFKTPSETRVDWHEDLFPGNILQIIAAARYAQMNNRDAGKKPLIIPVFYDYKNEMDDLDKIINKKNYDWKNYKAEEIAKLESVLTDLNLKDSFFIADISEPSSCKQISQLLPGNILLLSIGQEALPKLVFDGIYTYTPTDDQANNMWPPVREGATSFNSLLLTGKPHIRCRNDWEIGFDLITDSALKKTFEQLYPNPKNDGGLCQGMHTWRSDPTLYKQLGNFIIEAQYSNSPASKYFQTLKMDALNPKNDRILTAFEKAIDIFETTKAQKISPPSLAISDTAYQATQDTHTPSSIEASSNTYDEELPYDYGDWDTHVKYDSLFNHPIYTYRVYRNGQEVGSIEFYGQKQLCFSSDGKTHNVLHTTGILSEIHEKQDPSLYDICDVLPSSLLDRTIQSVKNGAWHGLIRGSSNGLGVTLHKLGGVSKKKSWLISQGVYYGSMFITNMNKHMVKTNHPDDYSFLDAFYLAAIDTAQLWCVNTYLEQLTHLLKRASTIAARRHQFGFSTGLNWCSKLAHFSVFAKDAVSNGVVESTGAMLAGAVAQTLVEEPIKFVANR